MSPATHPSPRDDHAMAYDPLRQRVVLAGGNGSQGRETWEWDGSAWTQVASNGPPFPGAAAYDATRRSTVVQTAGDTWVCDGSRWDRSRTFPVGRQDHAVAYDPSSQSVVLFGGRSSNAHSDTWLLSEAARADLSRYGSACAGTNGPPQITAGLPFLGNARFAIEVTSALPSAGATIGFAGAAGQLPLGGGCSLYLNGPAVWLPVATDASGFATLALPLPLHVPFNGITLYTQALVSDRNGSFGTWACTQGLGFKLGL